MRALALQSMTYDYQGHSPWKIDFFHVSKYSIILFQSPQNVLYLRQCPLSNPRILVLERDSCSMSLPCQKLRIHFQRTAKRKYIQPPTPTHCQGGPPGYYTYMLLYYMLYSTIYRHSFHSLFISCHYFVNLLLLACFFIDVIFPLSIHAFLFIRIDFTRLLIP